MAITKASGNAVAPAAKGDLVVGSATNDASVLSVGSANQGLIVDSATTTGLKWAESPQSLMTTTGDILYASSANTPARLGIGSSGNVLTVSGGIPAWSSAGGMTLIQETVASANSSISFSSISGSYKQLLLMWSGIQHSTSGSQFRIRFNNDSGSNYNYSELTFNNTISSSINASTDATAGASFGENAYNTLLYQLSFGYFLIDNYASTSKTKSYKYDFGFRNAANGFTNRGTGNGVYNSTSAISSIDIVRTVGSVTISNATNTSIRLYGVS